MVSSRVEKPLSLLLMVSSRVEKTLSLTEDKGSRPRTRRLEAKDLSFEAKAKDFKNCPRGQNILEDSTSVKEYACALCRELVFVAVETQHATRF